MGKIIITIAIVLVIYGIGIYFVDKILTKLRKKSMEKVANEMVEAGEITREQADAITWLINYKPRKK